MNTTTDPLRLRLQRITFPLAIKRTVLPLALIILACIPSMQNVVLQSLADAFLQVSVFVAATLYFYYFFVGRYQWLELAHVRQNFPHFEAPLAAFLGALPGCGGAIIVVTQFTKGQASFGSVVAVLVATMGDAAFLLLATKPIEGVMIMVSGLMVGAVCGYVVNAIHPENYLQPDNSKAIPVHTCHAIQDSKRFKVARTFWRTLLTPSLVLALLIAFQFNFDVISPAIEQYVVWFGAVSAFIVICLWSIASPGQDYQAFACEDDKPDPYSRLNKVIQDTHFVTTWVVVAFIFYELCVNLLGLDLRQWFTNYAILAPLIGMAIGLLPGCGPQILVTTLYIQGIVPFSALIANAMSNDGDALFPAIALAPKAALVATLYSSVPALIVGYGIYFIAS
ncbi:putative manganese transporter [Psychrobium sp. 1_MG-2023]|uniref:putative manganese transporter n=1 Tax=Psychrobium sp. 1_MG-2023 TaxID=3062624 RepID=UPI000C340CF4|nr:putative manganese transporter [Psychrobium sp. 1_MG-2023]MDP2561801.1 putative manganese transporter [Psychrobium sp. 1_MG-2023]PKF55825.1 hypothetical protein CW748_11840 [Alteromonadales bacterium alter-6D02]